MIKTIIVAIIGLFLLFKGMQVLGFFFKKKEQFVVASKMEGVVTFNGKPVPNLVLYREMSGTDFEEKDSVTTDKNGRFTFETVTQGTTLITHQSYTYKIFTDFKRNGEKVERLLIWKVGKDFKYLLSEIGELDDIIDNDMLRIKAELSNNPEGKTNYTVGVSSYFIRGLAEIKNNFNKEREFFDEDDFK